MVEIAADFLCQTVAQGKRSLERRSAQVEITVFSPDILAAVAFLFNGERWGYGLIENIDGLNSELDVSGRHFGVLALTLEYRSRYLDDVLAAK